MKKNLYTYINTKFFPSEYDNKMACFNIKLDENFMIENTFHLDNKMGIKE